MSVFVCRLPIPRWPHFLCGSIHPCPFQTKSIIFIWWCSQAGLSEDTAWNWCVSFQVYWGRQLPFGNSLRMLLQHSLSIPAQLFLPRSPSASDWFTLIAFPLSECSLLLWLYRCYLADIVLFLHILTISQCAFMFMCLHADPPAQVNALNLIWLQ